MFYKLNNISILENDVKLQNFVEYEKLASVINHYSCNM